MIIAVVASVASLLISAVSFLSFNNSKVGFIFLAAALFIVFLGIVSSGIFSKAKE